MLSTLRSECSKPGLRNWFGNNTDIRVLKLNVLCQIQSWTLFFFQIALWVPWSKLCFGFFAPSCACYLWIEFIENKVYRPWRDEMMKIGVGLSGGLLEDATANHFFMSMQAKGTVQESFNVSLMQLMQT